jgi:hypothetical protein
MGTSNIPNQRHSSITTTPALKGQIIETEFTVIKDYENATNLQKIKTNTVTPNPGDEEKPSKDTDLQYILGGVIAGVVLILAFIIGYRICRNSNNTSKYC